VSLKAQVRDFWNEASCGEVYADGTSRREQLEAQARTRYQLEPYIESFARFDEGRGRAVLEIGVGMGADHLRWAQAGPRLLVGMDLTPRAVDHTRFRSSDAGFTPRLLVADSELLPFESASFDLVYSWGVIHHTPDTSAAVREIHRVLKPGGVARVMIYHSRSITAALLWARWAVSEEGQQAYAQAGETPAHPTVEPTEKVRPAMPYMLTAEEVKEFPRYEKLWKEIFQIR